MDVTSYRFTLGDFRPNRRLSRCTNEPSIAGYIRWLRARAERLLPKTVDLTAIEVLDEWWHELLDDELEAQRAAGHSSHATFDLEPDSPLLDHVFAADTEPITFSEWSNVILASSDPNPTVKSRVRQPNGKLPRVSLKVHEIVATIALSDLYKAGDLLVTSSSEECKLAERLAAEQLALTWVIGATELVNRAERHANSAPKPRQAEATSPKRAKRAEVAASGPNDEMLRSRTRLAPTKANQIPEVISPEVTRIVKYSRFIEVTFAGQKKIIKTYYGSRPLVGLHYLIELLQEPQGRPKSLFALACDFRAKFGYGQARVTGDRNKSPILSKLEKIVASINEAKAAGDHKRVEELQNAAKKVQANFMNRDAKAARRPSPVRRSTPANVRAMERVKNSYLSTFPEFAEHIRKFVVTGFQDEVTYAPRPPVVWDVQESEDV